MELNRLTLKSQELLQAAHDMAQKHGNQAIEPVHFLKAMIEDDQGIVLSILKKIGVQVGVLKKNIQTSIEKLVKVSGAASIYLSQDSKKVLDYSFLEAGKMKDQYVSLEHIILSLTTMKGEAFNILKRNGVTREAILTVLKDIRGSQSVTDQNPEEKYQALEKFGRDLTMLAREGKLDPVIGRDEEIRRIVQVLSRRRKNNPVLIGEPGVGKT
ncbi:MAG: type VI secretion system ATPase TssH, partial [Desulfobacula sp.]|nr:type VI secretion system ATPase TssH [Desulfobacula sp.]